MAVEYAVFRDGLYMTGDVRALDEGPFVAVVGARACSGYGNAMARAIGRAVAEAGMVVVSGMARGVDGEAHRAALDAGGRTVAVLACGVDIAYPAAHTELRDRILASKGSAVVSEYKPGTPPAPWQFPARNRVIARIATAGVVIVEAREQSGALTREQSGALITVDYAMEYGRTVWAVPGEITNELARGCNQLIAQGHARAIADVGSLMDGLRAEIDLGAVAAQETGRDS